MKHYETGSPAVKIAVRATVTFEDGNTCEVETAELDTTRLGLPPDWMLYEGGRRQSNAYLVTGVEYPEMEQSRPFDPAPVNVGPAYLNVQAQLKAVDPLAPWLFRAVYTQQRDPELWEGDQA